LGLKPANFLGSRPSKLSVSIGGNRRPVEQRNPMTTNARFRVSPFQKFGGRLSANSLGCPNRPESQIGGPTPQPYIPHIATGFKSEFPVRRKLWGS
jgi:hypothetical protein